MLHIQQRTIEQYCILFNITAQTNVKGTNSFKSPLSLLRIVVVVRWVLSNTLGIFYNSDEGHFQVCVLVKQIYHNFTSLLTARAKGEKETIMLSDVSPDGYQKTKIQEFKFGKSVKLLCHFPLLTRWRSESSPSPKLCLPVLHPSEPQQPAHCLSEPVGFPSPVATVGNAAGTEAHPPAGQKIAV